MIIKKVLSNSQKELLLTLSMALVAVTIPLHNNLNSYALVLFCVTAFFLSPLHENFKRLSTHFYWILSAVFFIWLWSTWLWDTSGGFSIKYAESYAFFIVMPLVMTTIRRLTAKTVVLTCTAFALSTIIVSLLCLVRSFVEYKATGDSRVFFYHYLGQQMGLNAVYLSNYCIACISWLLYYRFIYNGSRPFRLPVTVVVILCLYLVVFVFLLSSKQSLVILLATLIVFILYIGYTRKTFLKSLLLITIFALSAFLLVKNLYYLHWRIAVTEFKQYSGPEDDQNGLAVRLLTWQSAIELIRERPLLGYGLKGAGEALIPKYQARDFQLGVNEKYNSHNQFLETALRAGLTGLAGLLLLLYIPLRRGFRQKKLLLIFSVLHFSIASLTEATLEYQQELTFYWFFIFLFYYHYAPDIKQVTTATKPVV